MELDDRSTPNQDEITLNRLPPVSGHAPNIEREPAQQLKFNPAGAVSYGDMAPGSNLTNGHQLATSGPERLCEIELEKSIVPAGVVVLLTEARVKQRGEVWQVHKHDADPFPSNPHAHNYRLGLKLDLGTGDLYSYKTKVSNKRLPKHLLVDLRGRIHRANSSIILPPLLV